MQRALGIVDRRQDNIFALRKEAEKVCLRPACRIVQRLNADI